MTQNSDIVHESVREHYAAQAVAGSCCGSDACCDAASQLYPVELLTELPADVTSFTLGCGDPITLADLLPGQTVLDLGSGGGLDCFLAARKVGETGRVIGVDMTPEMIERSRGRPPSTQCAERRVPPGISRELAGRVGHRRRCHLELRHQPRPG